MGWGGGGAAATGLGGAVLCIDLKISPDHRRPTPPPHFQVGQESHRRMLYINDTKEI